MSNERVEQLIDLLRINTGIINLTLSKMIISDKNLQRLAVMLQSNTVLYIFLLLSPNLLSYLFSHLNHLYFIREITLEMSKYNISLTHYGQTT
jgi:hypothetical protein